MKNMQMGLNQIVSLTSYPSNAVRSNRNRSSRGHFITQSPHPPLSVLISIFWMSLNLTLGHSNPVFSVSPFHDYFMISGKTKHQSYETVLTNIILSVSFKKYIMDLSTTQNTIGPVLSTFKDIIYHQCIF